MMKNRKALATSAILIIATCASVYAAWYYVWSGEVGHQVTEYQLTLGVSHQGRKVTFTGVLTLDGNGVSGKTIDIYHSDGSGNAGAWLTSATTTGDGSYTANYVEASAGYYYYMARAEIE